MEDKTTMKTQNVEKEKYKIKRHLAPNFRVHSNIAMLFYNEKVGGKSVEYSRLERRFARYWTSPVVPVALFVGHLYLIALFLRNPFQKVDLD